MKFPYVALHAAMMIAGLSATAASAATNLLQNGGFEATTTANSVGSSGSYAYPTGTFDGWTYDDHAGLIDGATATPWFGTNPPSGFAGAQYAFLQTDGTLSQTFTADASGALAISWLEGGRPYSSPNAGNQIYTVAINGTVLGTYTSQSNQNFMARSAAPFAVLAGTSYTLTFQGYSVYDNTAFLDQVSASVTAPVPEPAEWAMMIAGLGVVGVAARRRKPRA